MAKSIEIILEILKGFYRILNHGVSLPFLGTSILVVKECYKLETKSLYLEWGKGSDNNQLLKALSFYQS